MQQYFVGILFCLFGLCCADNGDFGGMIASLERLKKCGFNPKNIIGFNLLGLVEMENLFNLNFTGNYRCRRI